MSAKISVFTSHLFLLSPATHLSPVLISRDQKTRRQWNNSTRFSKHVRSATGNQGGRRAKKEVEICPAATPKSPLPFPTSCLIALHGVFIETQGETVIDISSSPSASLISTHYSYCFACPGIWLLWGWEPGGGVKESRAASLWTFP